jgi:hypothetical protein
MGAPQVAALCDVPLEKHPSEAPFIGWLANPAQNSSYQAHPHPPPQTATFTYSLCFT